MNKSFVLLDKNNNIQKSADIIVKFNFEGLDYLIYSVEESEQNNQVFVSKLILNSEGKYFIDSISTEEKGKLKNIVYNIVILIPVEVQKGSSFESLSDNLFEKFAVQLSNDIPSMDVQEYFSSCSVAITSKILAEEATKLYHENLNNDSQSGDVLIPTWTAPSEVTAPIPASTIVNGSDNTSIDSTFDLTSPAWEKGNVTGLNLQSTPIENTAMSMADVPTSLTDDVDVLPNPQAEKLAIVSDPSLSSTGINIQQTNVGKLKKAGFANTKYIIIGTVCLVLAVLVVIIAYIVIKNMK